MATTCASELFVGLAVMVNDWNDFLQPPTTLNNTHGAEELEATSKAVELQDEVESSWKTDFEEMIIDFWTHTTSVVKRKWRRACAEMFQHHSDDEQTRPPTPERTADEAHLLD